MMSDIDTTDLDAGNAMKPRWKIENVVCTASITITSIHDHPLENGKIDLNVISRKYVDTRYNPERFPGLITKVEDTGATVLLFSTGKMVITGLKAADKAAPTVDHVLGMLEASGFAFDEAPVIELQNFVSSGDLGTPINLDKASLTLENAVYEPEVFPGAICRVQDPKSVILLFSTGRFVVTGVKKKAAIQQVVDKLVESVKKHGLNIIDPVDGDFDFI